MSIEERNAAMCELRRAGWSLRRIGAAFNLSYQTVKNATWRYAESLPQKPFDRAKHEAMIHRNADTWRCALCGSSHYRYSTRALFCLPCDRKRAAESGKQQAHADVAKAIKQGLLRPASQFLCVDCGGQAREYDHRDYSKTLEVEPVCRPCNAKRGPGKWVKHLPVREIKRARVAA